MREPLDLLLVTAKSELPKYTDSQVKMHLRNAIIGLDRAIKRIIFLRRKKANNELEVERAQKEEIVREQFKARARILKQGTYERKTIQKT